MLYLCMKLYSYLWFLQIRSKYEKVILTQILTYGSHKTEQRLASGSLLTNVPNFGPNRRIRWEEFSLMCIALFDKRGPKGGKGLVKGPDFCMLRMIEHKTGF